MAPRLSNNSDDSDSDVPEAVSFNSSKKTAHSHVDALQKSELAAKLKQKEKNRERDRKLKERAELTKGNRESRTIVNGKSIGRKEKGRLAVSEEADEESEGQDEDRDNDLEARMERAMREAAEESDEDEEDFAMYGNVPEHGEGESDEEMSTENDAEDSEMETDEDVSSEAEHTIPLPKSKALATSKTRLDYLPDHLFAAALAQMHQNSKPESSSKARKTSSTQPPQKKRKRSKSSKDIIVGQRTIRTLPSSAVAPHANNSELCPPVRINRFLERSLQLKGASSKRGLIEQKRGVTRGKAGTKVWERRPANLGVMRRVGNVPAATFVRHTA